MNHPYSVCNSKNNLIEGTVVRNGVAYLRQTNYKDPQLVFFSCFTQREMADSKDTVAIFKISKLRK